MTDVPLNLAEIEQRIAAVRENISEVIEQAAAYSGAADEELAARRVAVNLEPGRVRKPTWARWSPRQSRLARWGKIRHFASIFGSVMMRGRASRIPRGCGIGHVSFRRRKRDV